MLYSETELKKRLKSGCPVFYFYASDEALVRSAAAKAEKFLSEEAPDTTTLDGPTPSVEDIVLAAGTISFFGGRRLVILPLIRPSAYSDKDLQELCDTLSDTENAVFVLTSLLEEKYGKIKPGKREQKLIAACEKLGYCVQLTNPGRAALQEMARTWAGEYHTTFAPGAEAALLDRCGDQVLMEHPTALLVLMRRMFTWGQIPRMRQLKELLLESVRRHPELTDRQRGNLLGECDLIESFLYYNDIGAMSRFHRSASRQMTRQAVSIQSHGSWTFGSPSVLMMFHRTPGQLDRELADTQQRAGNLRAQADALTDRIDQIDAETQDLARQLEELMDALRQLAESAGSAQQEAEALRAKETLAVADAARGRTELAALDATRTQAQARQAAIAADSAAAREKLDQCRREAEENNASLTAAREEEQAAANVIQGHSLKMEGRRRRAQEAAQQAEQLRRQLAAMEDRIRLLTEMEKDYEGFSRAVKGVMQAADRGTLPGSTAPWQAL